MFEQNQIFPPGDPVQWLDAPSLGIDTNALYIGGNEVTNTIPLSASLFIFPKAPLLNGNPVGTAFRGFVGINGPVGVDNFDPAPTQGFFIVVQQKTPPIPGTSIFLIIIDNPATTPMLAGFIPIPVDPTNSPPNAPHKGALQGTPILTLDNRFVHAHIWKNQLFASHDEGVDQTGNFLMPDRAALRWYQIDISSPLFPVVVQQSTFFDSALTNPRFFYFGALMTNIRGDLALGCTTSAADQFIDAMVVGRLVTDPPNTLQAPTFLTNSQFSYNYFSNIDSASVGGGGIGRQRWGDYSYTALDPDNMTMWTAQEFCARTDNWGIQIAQLLAP